ncbi:hypothetical protein KGF57_005160 [Candida theae]|uniref:Uncharacterized protein n=1 Tax=Candida theae TaxID=1198502 RepID=A0AAD5FW54_9ASCO|nr:uncharacterized protein KGF57_005160 [Candida theae]KAI5948762.1 hypothetical protein KGF57_005160 [Candida theae]
MTFIKLEELSARSRLNYDTYVIKHQLDKLIKPIEEYKHNVSRLFEIPNLCIKERKRVTDELISKLRELRTTEICTNTRSIWQVLQHRFPIQLSTVVCNDRQLFELTTYFIRTFMVYANTNDCREVIPIVATILSNHLNTLTIHNQLAPYQLPYTNRLVSDVLKICETNIDIIAIWLSESTSSSINEEIRRHSVNFLPIQQIIENFLMHELKTFKTANWENFVRLSRRSRQLNEYLCSQPISVFDTMTNLYFFPPQEDQLLHISVHEPVLSAVIKVIEGASPELGLRYFATFFNTFKKSSKAPGYNDDTMLFILQTSLSLGATTTLSKLFGNFFFQLYLNDKLQESRVSEKFLCILADILHRQDTSILKLLSTKDANDMQFSGHNSTVLDNIRIKVMDIHNGQVESVSERFTELILEYSASLECYKLDVQGALISQVVQLLLQYFQNTPSLDASLNKFSLMLFLKFNMLSSATFVEVIHYLIISYEVYQLHLRMYELYQYDPVELSRILSQHVTPPSCKILAHYGIGFEAQCINYVTLPTQLDLCQQLITDFYISCKLKKKKTQPCQRFHNRIE